MQTRRNSWSVLFFVDKPNDNSDRCGRKTSRPGLRLLINHGLCFPKYVRETEQRALFLHMLQTTSIPRSRLRAKHPCGFSLICNAQIQKPAAAQTQSRIRMDCSKVLTSYMGA